MCVETKQELLQMRIQNVWGDKMKVRRRQRRQNKTTSQTVNLVIKKKWFAMHQWLRYLARAVMDFFHEPFAVWP
jgi:hypothetical protein